MDIYKVVGLIATSSVLSAILTGLVSIWIQNLNYKREYYKQLIGRRIEAQEQIIILSNELKVQVSMEEGFMCNRVCASGIDHFNSFVIAVASSVNISFWLSNEISDILLELNIFLLNEISHEIEGITTQEQDISVLNLGREHNETLREFRKRIDRQLTIDFSKLSNIRSFVKRKNNYDDKLYNIKN